MKVSKEEREHSLNYLRSVLSPNATVYAIVRHVSRSGMSRNIDFYAVHNGRMAWLTGAFANVLGYRRAKDGNGLVVGGCGMDMAFHCVHQVGGYLWPTGTPEPHGTRNGEPDRSGGYALKSEVL